MATPVSLAAPTLPPIRERAAAGAKRLSLPSAGSARWAHLVQLGSLDLGSCTDCVLGQVYGSFDLGLEQLGLFDPLEVISLGFDTTLDDGQAGLEELTAAWMLEILAARKAMAA